MSYIGATPTSTAFLTDSFSGDGTTTSFTLSAAPASSSSILVAVSGVLQDPATYAVVGTALNFTGAPPSGTANISVRYLGVPASNISTTAYRTVTEFTATAGQTSFSTPSYTVGFINVYRNGVLLGSADYTATTGTTVVLASGATAGDLITTESFYVSSIYNAISNTAGSVNSNNIADGAVGTAELASGAVDLTTKVTGVLPEANGGTGTTTGYYGFKNRIINGAMMIDQRNAGASVTPANGGADYIYTLDRWRVFSIANSKFSVQQNAGSVTPPVGFNNYLGITSLTATSVGSADLYLLGQRIEGFNFADMGWGTSNAQSITISFWVRSSLTGTFGGALQNSAINRSYPFSYIINATNTWEYKTITIAGDTSGTWVGATNGAGCTIQLGLGVGLTYSGTTGSWSGSAFFSATGATSVVGTNGATFYITGVQLEKGSTATSFDYRPYGTELALCQRYFQESRTMSGYGTGSTAIQGSVSLVVTMRASPSLSKTANNFQITDGISNYQSTLAPSSYFGGVSGGSINHGGFSGLTSQRPVCLDGQTSFAGYTFSAEL